MLGYKGTTARSHDFTSPPQGFSTHSFHFAQQQQAEIVDACCKYSSLLTNFSVFPASAGCCGSLRRREQIEGVHGVSAVLMSVWD